LGFLFASPKAYVNADSWQFRRESRVKVCPLESSA
jgi:hypothetical protein